MSNFFSPQSNTNAVVAAAAAAASSASLSATHAAARTAPFRDILEASPRYQRPSAPTPRRSAGRKRRHDGAVTAYSPIPMAPTPTNLSFPSTPSSASSVSGSESATAKRVRQSAQGDRYVTPPPPLLPPLRELRDRMHRYHYYYHYYRLTHVPNGLPGTSRPAAC